MKVLALSDLHSEQRVIDSVLSLTTRNRYDAVFIVGDISDYGDTKYVDALFEVLDSKNTYAIPGNMDDDAVRRRLADKCRYIHLKKETIKVKYEIFGIGGGLRGPFGTAYEYDDDELWNKIKNTALSSPSIVLSHSPPYGYFDEISNDVHIGSRSVLRFMQANKPFILICGHIHENKGCIKSDETNIVKLGPASKGNAVELEFIYKDAKNNELKTKWIEMF